MPEALRLVLEGVPAGGIRPRPSGGECIRAEIERYIGVEVSEKLGVYWRVGPIKRPAEEVL